MDVLDNFLARRLLNKVLILLGQVFKLLFKLVVELIFLLFVHFVLAWYLLLLILIKLYHEMLRSALLSFTEFKETVRQVRLV